jgi:hypothetical protein
VELGKSRTKKIMEKLEELDVITKARKLEFDKISAEPDRFRY